MFLCKFAIKLNIAVYANQSIPSTENTKYIKISMFVIPLILCATSVFDTQFSILITI